MATILTNQESCAVRMFGSHDEYTMQPRNDESRSVDIILTENELRAIGEHVKRLLGKGKGK